MEIKIIQIVLDVWCYTEECLIVVLGVEWAVGPDSDQVPVRLLEGIYKETWGCDIQKSK